MNKVVKLNTRKDSVLQEDDTIDIDEAEIQRAAMTVFEEMMDGGCGLRDCITAVYFAGMERITGLQKVKRIKKPAVPPCPHDAIVALYHEHLPMLPGVSVMNPARRKALRALWVWIFESRKADGSRRATTADEGLKWIAMYFTRATDNDFLMGKTKRSEQHKGWQPDLDYVVSASGMKQILERTTS